MPIQYKDSIMDATKHCRQHASLFDVSHMCGVTLKVRLAPVLDLAPVPSCMLRTRHSPAAVTAVGRFCRNFLSRLICSDPMPGVVQLRKS